MTPDQQKALAKARARLRLQQAQPTPIPGGRATAPQEDTLAFARGRKAPEQRSVGQAVREGFDGAVGERLGIDPETNAAIGRTFGKNAALIAPLADVGATLLELPGAALGVGAELAGEAIQALGADDPKGGRGVAADLKEFATIGTLPFAGSSAGRSMAKTSKAAKPLTDTAERAEIAQAAERQGISLLPADVGGTTTKRVTSILNQSPLASGSIQKAAKKNIERFENAVDTAARSVGTPGDVSDLGESLQRGSKAFTENTRRRSNELFEDLTRKSAGVEIAPQQTVKKLQSEIAELSQTPGSNAEKLRVLKGVMADFVDGTGSLRPLPVDAVRAVRTNLRDKLKASGLTGTDIDRRIKGLTADITADIESGLAGSPAALSAFRRANGYYKARQTRIEGALNKIVGKNADLSAEQSRQKIMSMTGRSGNANALSKTLKSLPRDDRNDVVASLVSQLGKNKPDADFSVSTFVAQLNNMTPKAKSTLFDGQLGKAINDLEAVAKGMAETQRFANNSNTGSAVVGTGTMLTAIADLQTGLSAAIAQYGAGKMMSSPRFVRLLSNSLKTQNEASRGKNVSRAVERHSQELAAIVAANDNSAIGVGDFLGGALGPYGSGKAVAEERQE